MNAIYPMTARRVLPRTGGGVWVYGRIRYTLALLFSPMKPERMGGKSSELKTAVEAKVGIIAPAKL